VLLGQGKKIAEGVKAVGVTKVAADCRRQEVGGRAPAQAKRRTERERENGQLRKIVADRTRDTLILQEATKKNC
jgi:putative transposase